ncbi:hypothetical protein MXD62_19455 [Frankia sp. Mgl5]|uniref:hypothetical protein n=1 Tax=Frankia sp. Mgl5 TaxID=2933793 RepID=UPI00200D07BC|nr:hypothetical protein [Frankia sp. Mgl5]MCK9929329.1 hypothetical protein [Frankia sp. Mgl5]
MPQPPENAADAAALIAAYEAAQRVIDSAVRALRDRPTAAQSRRQHPEIRIGVDVVLDAIGVRTSEWAAERLPAVAARGAAAAVAVLPDVAETGIDPAAVVADVADELVQALARATDTVRTSLAAMLRAVATDPQLAAAVRVRDVAPALRRLEQLADGVYAVRYANGTRMPLGAYADMLIRTITARAYNAGTLEAARAHGVGAVQVADGLGCPWPGGGHGMPPTADGLVVSVALAEEHPIAHPNCQRSFTLLPDITDQSALDDGELDTVEPVDPTPVDTAGQAAARAVVRTTVARYRARLEARARRLAARRTRRSTNV